MRFRKAKKAMLSAVMSGIAVAGVHQCAAQQRYCPDPARGSPGKVPAQLTKAVAGAFQIDEATVRAAAFVRCADQKLMGCYTGANLNCFKADTRRTLPGASAWCHEHPGSKGIPMSATGHDTIYDWSCSGTRAVAGEVVLAVDEQGYIADNWKEIR
jgi:hypothetical protein